MPELSKMYYLYCNRSNRWVISQIGNPVRTGIVQDAFGYETLEVAEKQAAIVSVTHGGCSVFQDVSTFIMGEKENV